MSDTKCQPGDTSGFPLKLAQSLHSPWPAIKDSQTQIKNLTVPTDFTVNWGPPTQSAQVSVTNTVAANGFPGVFQIRGIQTITDSTNLILGTANYKCSGVLSIVQNQHTFFNNIKDALYEVILAFQISNKSTNPSSPDIILLTRPIVFSKDTNSSTFWPAVDEASVRKNVQSVALDMSTMFGYNSSTLMPMITYQTCLPVKLLNYKTKPYSYGSLRVRVSVVTHPLYMVASENGLGRCSIIRNYTFTTEPRNVVDVFDGTSSNTLLQFKDGYGQDGYPIQTKANNLVPFPPPVNISAFSEILQKVEILVPEVFLGKSLAEIVDTKKPPPAKSKKKAFKCYTIDPTKDIVGDQIMVDPTTGKSLLETIDSERDISDSMGINTIYYTLSGPKITGSLPVLRTFPAPQTSDTTIPDLTAFIAQDGLRVKVVYASLSNTSNITQSLSFIGDSSTLTSYLIVQSTIKGLKSTDDLKDDTGSVIINVISINNLTASSSGILPGDIERILVVIFTIVGSIVLFAYLGFIVHMWIYRENGLHNSVIHIFTFIVLLVLLILFGIYVEKPTEEAKS